MEPDIMQDQGDIKLAACSTGGYPCQSASWTAGYLESRYSFIGLNRFAVGKGVATRAIFSGRGFGQGMREATAFF